MKIASWNVNSLRVRLPQVLDWLARHEPDILALQETKMEDEQFPAQETAAAGYQAIFCGQKAYNGVAILSRQAPESVLKELPGSGDSQRRFLAASYGNLRLVNVYVPNGEHIDSDKYLYKLEWLDSLADFLESELVSHPRLVLLGDFNIAPEAEDVYDPESWEGQVLFSEPEREAFRRLLSIGLVDTFRQFPQEPGAYSWWDYRMNAFRRNMGLRIDHILAGRILARDCTGCGIDKAPRALPRASDHAPVIATFK